jgi:hypothetical protein
LASITRFHVSWLLTSALPQIVVGGLGTPRLGSQQDYGVSATAAPTFGSAWLKPWGTYTVRHQYWSTLLGAGYATADPYSAWVKQVPLMKAPGFTPTSDLPDVTVTCDRYLYPSGVGVAVTATFEGEVSIPEATELQRKLVQDPVFKASNLAMRTIGAILADELDLLAEDVLGTPSQGAVQSDRLTLVTTIAGAKGEVSAADATALLNQMCYPGQPPGGTPQVLPARTGNFKETIRVAGENSQASWSPKRSTTPRGTDGLTCYHHNLVLCSLHVTQALNLARFAGDRPFNAPDRAQQLYKLAVSLLGWAYGSSLFYSTAFTRAAVDESGLLDQVNAVRQVYGEEPLHPRNA